MDSVEFTAKYNRVYCMLSASLKWAWVTVWQCEREYATVCKYTAAHELTLMRPYPSWVSASKGGGRFNGHSAPKHIFTIHESTEGIFISAWKRSWPFSQLKRPRTRKSDRLNKLSVTVAVTWDRARPFSNRRFANAKIRPSAFLYPVSKFALSEHNHKLLQVKFQKTHWSLSYEKTISQAGQRLPWKRILFSHSLFWADSTLCLSTTFHLLTHQDHSEHS